MAEKIYYKDFATGKERWAHGKSFSVQYVNWLGREITALVVHRKSDDLIIPAWCVDPRSRHLLSSGLLPKS